MTAWTNDDGLVVHFGADRARNVNQTFGNIVVNGVRYFIVDFEWDNMPAFTADLDNNGTNDGYSDEDVYIPSGSFITNAYTIIHTAFAGAGTETWNFGLYQKDGTVLDADGIDAAVAFAAMGANKTIVHDGALVRTTTKLTANAYPVFVASAGTITAGKARTVIEFIPGRPA